MVSFNPCSNDSYDSSVALFSPSYPAITFFSSLLPSYTLVTLFESNFTFSVSDDKMFSSESSSSTSAGEKDTMQFSFAITIGVFSDNLLGKNCLESPSLFT